MSRRIQRKRERGWRMPAGAVVVSRPSVYGNPFEWNGGRAIWMALAFGHRAGVAGRRAASVIGYRWWINGGDPATFPVAASGRNPGGGEIEYSDGTVRTFSDLLSGLGLMMFLKDPLKLPPRPDLGPLRGHDLACWCPLDQPCHADVLLELANA